MPLPQPKVKNLEDKLKLFRQAHPEKFLTLGAEMLKPGLDEQQRKTLISLYVTAENITRENAEPISHAEATRIADEVVQRSRNLTTDYQANPGLFKPYLEKVWKWGPHVGKFSALLPLGLTISGVPTAPFLVPVFLAAASGSICSLGKELFSEAQQEQILHGIDTVLCSNLNYIEKKIPGVIHLLRTVTLNTMFPPTSPIYDFMNGFADDTNNDSLAQFTHLLTNNLTTKNMIACGQGATDTLDAGATQNYFNELAAELNNQNYGIKIAAAERRTRLAEHEQFCRNTQAMANVASFVLKDVFKKPNIARCLQEATIQLSMVSLRYSNWLAGTAGVSWLTVAEGVVTAASAIYSSWQGPARQEKNIVFEFFGCIIEDLQEKLRDGFIILAKGQEEIVKKLDEIIRLQKNALRELRQLGDSIEKFRKEQNEAQRDRAITGFKNTCRHLEMQMKNPMPNVDTMLRYLTDLEQYAVNTSRESIFTGGNDNLNIIDDIRKRNRLHLSFHLLQRLRLPGVGETKVPNLLEWSRASSYFIEVLSLWPVPADRQVALADLAVSIWQTGIELMLFVAECSNLTTILDELERYNVAYNNLITGIIDIIKECREQKRINQIKPRLQACIKEEIGTRLAPEIAAFENAAMILLYGYQLNLLRQPNISSFSQPFASVSIAWESGVFDLETMYVRLEQAANACKVFHIEAEVRLALENARQQTVATILKTAAELPMRQSVDVLMLMMSGLSDVAERQGLGDNFNLAGEDYSQINPVAEPRRNAWRDRVIPAEVLVQPARELVVDYAVCPKITCWSAVNSKRPSHIRHIINVQQNKFLTLNFDDRGHNGKVSLWDIGATVMTKPLQTWNVPPASYAIPISENLYRIPGNPDQYIDCQQNEIFSIPGCCGQSSVVLFQHRYLIFSTHSNNLIKVWDLTTKNFVAIPGENLSALHSIRHLKMLSDDVLLVYGGVQQPPHLINRIVIYKVDLTNPNSGFEKIKETDHSVPIHFKLQLKPNIPATNQCINLPNLIYGQHCFVALSGYLVITVFNLDPAHRKPILEIKSAEKGNFYGIRSFDDERIICVLNVDGTRQQDNGRHAIELLNLKDAQRVVRLGLHRRWVQDFSRLGKDNIVSIAEDSLKIWQVSSASCLRMFPLTGFNLNAVRLLVPSQDKLVVAIQNKLLLIHFASIGPLMGLAQRALAAVQDIFAAPPPVRAPQAARPIVAPRIRRQAMAGIVPHRDYASLSFCVYNLDDLDPSNSRQLTARQRLPARRWNIYLDSRDENLTAQDFFAVAYISDDLKAVVIAIRGTVSAENWLANIDIMRGSYPKAIYDDACVFYQRVKEKLMADAARSHYPISCTGHSLGAFLAQMLAWEHNVTGVTFDCPGIYDGVMMRWREKYKAVGRAQPYQHQSGHVPLCNIYNYLAQPNVVNTCATQLGTMLVLEDFESPNITALYGTLMGFYSLIRALPGLTPRGFITTIVAPFLAQQGVNEFQKHAMKGMLDIFLAQNDYPPCIRRVHEWPGSLGEFINLQTGLNLDSYKTTRFSLITIKKNEFPGLNDNHPPTEIWQFYTRTLPALIADSPDFFLQSVFNERLINLANSIEEINTEVIKLKVTAGVSCLVLQQAFFDLYRILPDNIKTYTPDIAVALKEFVNQQALVGYAKQPSRFHFFNSAFTDPKHRPIPAARPRAGAAPARPGVVQNA